MKLIAWNCRGLSSSRAVRALLDVQGCLKPDVVFLSETHLDNAKADKVRRRAGFDHKAVFESEGTSGGLLLMWKEEVKIQVNSVSKIILM
jgi:exonuclease III